MVILSDEDLVELVVHQYRCGIIPCNPDVRGPNVHEETSEDVLSELRESMASGDVGVAPGRRIARLPMPIW